MIELSRAAFLRLTLGALVIPARARGVAGQDDGRASRRAAAADRTARVERVIEAYDAQGFHRTATDVDDRSGRWLADAAAQAGATVKLDTFAVQRVDIRAAYVEADGHRIEGVPFYDASFTDARGVTGRFNEEVALAEIDAAGISSEGQSLAALRRSPAHRAIVAVTRGGHPGLSLSNAGAFSVPYGVPVLQVGSAEHGWLSEIAARGREVRVVVDAGRTSAQAANIVATIEGRDAGRAPLVVMTPRSGWWHCASERGGGLACWLEAIRAVAATRAARPLVAIASSGHELGHFGLDAFLAKEPGLVKRATWIHLGANIGAAQGGARLQASDEGIEAMADEALERAGADVRQHVPRGTRPAGEARNIHDGGGRYVSLLGSGPYFHNVADRWPLAVDVASVTRFSQAFAELAVALAT